MKKYVLLLCLIAGFTNLKAQTTLTIMDSAVFYDGYAALVNQPTPPNIIRLRNDVMTTRITESQIAQLGDSLTINISIFALCDNYDRIGGVNLVMAPKGSTTYKTDSVSKIEIGRFITPFMNKNKNPKFVPYSFSVNNICRILKSPEFNSLYDFWLELEVFGVPYAANTQIAGCSGRNDVFRGKVEFVTNGPVTNWSPATILQPLSFKAYFNNYQAGASDAIGTNIKTINFTVDQTVYNAKLYLITSNHGANEGGEEYIRRNHIIKVDGVQKLSYIPGGKSCEPFRKYNTQANGIYGPSPMTESEWLSFNNWCPGDVIPIRPIDLGTLVAGAHTFVFSVPLAQFANKEGYFPVSLYLQGNKSDITGIEELASESVRIYPNPATTAITVDSKFDAKKIQLLNPFGQVVLNTTDATIDISKLANGIYFIQVTLENGSVVTQQFVKN